MFLTALVAPSRSDALPSVKVHRMGFLSGFSARGAASVRAFVVEALRDLGYRDGENMLLTERYADGKLERLPALARELIAERVSVVMTQTTPAALAAKAATSTVAIVIVTGGDAVGSGLVATLAKPGSNVTGLSFLGTELAVKQMEILKELAPSITRVGLLANPGIPPEITFFREMERAAPRLGAKVHFVRAGTSADYAVAFASIGQSGVEGLVVAPSVMNHEEWESVVRMAVARRIPTVYPFREFVEAGGLTSYGFNRREFFGLAARYVDKILKGAKPAELPVEQPTKFELAVNLKTAKALHIVIPPELMVRAEKVIE
jgi:putative ABC transport system substrate-binding protein